ncbi:non-ribosomal peptide synthetase [Aquimarina intermedia]|uniref:Tyrocidine synthetase-3 n=1 Tax=Aquimarina intermedia TaxID=350814 RepID=A0A5S5C7P6_9FLAO|nr:non-ribosomal peptide synthetase [Aquimarina intermedia]TYP74350.1 tyrocidine synthetase-3 [Aquimarina intermedia]
MKDLINRLIAKGIFLEANGSKLDVYDSHKNLTEDLVAELKEKKPELLTFLENNTVSENEWFSIPKAEIKDNYLLSSAQKRMYFLYEFDKESIAYNMPQIYQFSRTNLIDRLEVIFNGLFERHEILRSNFNFVNGKLAQQVKTSVDFKIERFTASAEEVDNLVENFIRPFNLQEDVLLRVGLITVKGRNTILMLDMHHIVSDGVSQKILLKDFVTLAENKPLQPLKLQYKDYAEWQQSDVQKKLLLKDQKFWLNLYKEPVTALELPLDSKRSEIKSGHGASYSFRLPKTIEKGLQKIAKEEEVTMFMLLLSLFNVVLSKLSNQDDIVVGTPTSGRTHADLEGIVGMFVNTLPLRNTPTSSKSFTEFLKEVKNNTIQSFNHQSYQYEDLVETLGVERNTDRNPLFDVMFLYTKDDTLEVEQKYELFGGDISSYDTNHTVSKFDITLSVTDHTEGISFDIEYAQDLFSDATIVNFAKYFENIVTDICSNKAVKLEEISLISDEQINQILEKTTDRVSLYKPTSTVLDLFRKQVDSHPNHNAITCDGNEITYTELDIKSTQFAKYLIKKGVKPEALIPICIERSIELIISILGIMKAGCAYVPIDPMYPSARIKYIIENTDPTLILVSPHLKNNIPDIGDEVEICSISKALFLTDYTTEIKLPKVAPDHLAYVIFTSGTTGNPKGVLIEHHSLTNCVLTAKEVLTLDASLKMLGVTSATFDISLTEFFLPLVTGGILFLVTQSQLEDPNILVKEISKLKPTLIQTTPSRLQSLLTVGWKNVENLTIVSGGEALSKKLLKKLLMISERGIWNWYGPTEATIWSTFKLLQEDSHITIGNSLGNIQTYVVSPDHQLLPYGIAGELCIGGAGVGRGYLKNKKLTKSKFVKNPFISGARMYKTGDLARRLENGEIELIGRNDNQVKINGYRVELGEIRTQLQSIPELEDAVVTVRKDGNDDDQLVAYVIKKNNIKTTEISRQLSKMMPYYMLPHLYIVLEALPRLINGKVDYKALPNSVISKSDNFRAPTNEIQRKLRALWANVLKQNADNIGIDTSFFDLGGHSLNAIELVNKINTTFSVELPLRELFIKRTISKLAIFIEEEFNESFDASVPNNEASIFELTSAQKRVYFLYDFDRNALINNNTRGYKFEKTLNADRVVSIFKKLIERHAMLRTKFGVLDGEPKQRVYITLPFEISVFEDINANNVPDAITSFIRPFDLSKEAAVRVGLIQLVDEGSVLVIDMHEIVSDSVSQRIVISEFLKLYENQQISNLSNSFEDYIELVQTEAYKNKIKKHEPYWLSLFKRGQDVLELPYDFPRPLVKDVSGSNVLFNIEHEQYLNLKQFATEKDIVLESLIFAFFGVLLHKISSQDDITIGFTAARPNHGFGKELVGLFQNTLAMRNHPEGYKTFIEYLNEIINEYALASQHMAYPYELLVESLDVNRDASRNPLFDVFYTFQTQKDYTLTDQNNNTSHVETCRFERNISKFDLSFDVLDTNDALSVQISYMTALFEKNTIERFANYFTQIVNAVLADSEIKLSEIDIVDTVEKDILLHTYNVHKPVVNKDTVLTSFAEAVLKYESRTALIGLQQRLSYAQFDKITLNIASALVEVYDVKKGTLIGLHLERDESMVLIIYGILKAGAAYVPLDPKHPIARKESIIKDSGLKFIITNVAVSFEENKVPIVNALTLLANSQKVSSDIQKVVPTVNQKDLAYVIYTSGSTGTPKGVMVSHSALYNTIMSMQHRYPVKQDGNFLFKTNYAFDVSMSELFGWYHSGGSLSVLEKGEEANVDKILQTIESNKVTHINFVPSMFSLFIDKLEEVGIDKIAPLSFIFLAGEALSKELVAHYRRLGPTDVQLQNVYGPTEAAIYSSAYSLKTFSLDRNISVPIGKPLDNVLLYVLDEKAKLQGIGIVGELCIGGNGVAMGYLNNEVLSAEKFIKNPFGEGLLYKTGDLVRWLSSGDIEFLGRKDDQVKIRGYRMELGEIQYRLSQYSEISECAVVVKKDSGDAMLVGYYVGEKELSNEAITAFLSASLPPYMIPSHFMKLEELPLTRNGKLDKKSLPSPTIILTEEYVLPKGETEKKLACIWASILNIPEETIGSKNSFFDLGGHSLKAGFLVSKLFKEFGISIPLKIVFSHPDISALANYIDDADKQEYVSFSKTEEKEMYALSSIQKRMFIQDEYDENVLNNMSYIYLFEGEIDMSRFKKAFDKIFERHEILRAYYDMVDDKIVQKFRKEAQFEIAHFSATEDEVDTIVNKFIRRFDLRNDLLFRIGIITLAKEKFILMIDMHHIVSDGVSVAILGRDFDAFYNNKPLPELRYQYRDFVEWQQSPARQKQILSKKEFWKNYLKDLTILNLPHDIKRPLVSSNEGDNYFFKFDKDLTHKIKDHLKQEGGITAYMFILSAFNVLLYKISHQNDIVIGTPVAGREFSEFDDLVGPFINSVPIRTFLNGDLTFQDLLKDIRENVLDCVSAQAYFDENVLNDVYVMQDSSNNSIWNVFFAAANFEPPKVEISDVKVSDHTHGTQHVMLDLFLTLMEGDDETIFCMEYSSELFSRKTIERFASYLEHIVTYVIDNSTTTIDAIEMLAEEERTVLLNDFNGAILPIPENKTLVDLFEVSAASFPDAIAVTYNEIDVSYAMLDQRVNQLAHYLLSEGVSRGDRVMLCEEKSIDLIVCIMAIFKIGAVYVQLNPNLPEDRLRYIMSDTGSDIVVLGVSVKDRFSENLFPGKLISMDAAISVFPTTPPVRNIGNDHLAYMIYTSGSTGQPKGTLVTHKSLVDKAIAWREIYDLDTDTRLLQMADSNFDVFIGDLCRSLLNGGQMVLCSSKDFYHERLYKLLSKYKITILEFTPGIIIPFMKYIAAHEKDVSFLKTLIIGSDMCSVNEFKYLIDTFGDQFKIINSYGATEATIDSVYFVGNDIDNFDIYRALPIGKPLPNTSVYIVDNNLRLVPIGVYGELCIGGVGVSNGYHNKEALTEEKFLENPFVENSKAKLYRTGDIGRWLPDGTIEFIGREDDQIKIRGYRVELGEIESTLVMHKNIKAAVVVPFDKNNQTYLSAYLVSDTEFNDSELWKFLFDKLPYYMIPSHYQYIDEIPLTSNGKIDRKSLPVYDANIEQIIVAPTTQTQKTLRDIYAKSLKIEAVDIGVTVNFFELGGTSLIAISMLNTIFKVFNIDFSLKELFANPTIELMSEFIDTSKWISEENQDVNKEETTEIRI